MRDEVYAKIKKCTYKNILIVWVLDKYFNSNFQFMRFILKPITLLSLIIQKFFFFFNTDNIIFHIPFYIYMLKKTNSAHRQ